MEKVIFGLELGGWGEGGIYFVELRSWLREYFIYFINKCIQFINLIWGLVDFVCRFFVFKVRKRDDLVVCFSDYVDYVLFVYQGYKEQVLNQQEGYLLVWLVGIIFFIKCLFEKIICFGVRVIFLFYGIYKNIVLQMK